MHCAPQAAILRAVLDDSLLPPCKFAFVVIADTHYLPDPGDGAVEFESRCVQGARVAAVLQTLVGVDVPLVVHLGDLIQDYPGTARYTEALAQVQRQIAHTGMRFHLVAGNHDVGDKPDPTMPAPWATAESLARFHALFGPSWYSFDQGGVHFVVLNSSIMNGPLPEEAEQRRWLAHDLEAHTAQRIYLFLHYPPYLCAEDEPALGIYDNLAQPARGWLLDLARRFRVELVFAGHCHYSWFDRLGPVRFWIAASTSFTRPGFSELFSSAPPDDRGRNDVAKLGYYLVRVHGEGHRVHFMRTGGETDVADRSPAQRHLVTRLPRDRPGSPLGVVLHHPLTSVVDLPSVWPSVGRLRVRNDYPFLACLELGVRAVRAPASDLRDPLQRRRLELLRDEGVQVVAEWLWSDQLDLPRAAGEVQTRIDGAVLQLLATTKPPADCLRQIKQCVEAGLETTLSTVIPRQPVSGKQHLRTRIGYLVAELTELDRCLAQAAMKLDRVIVRVGAGESPWAVAVRLLARPAFGQIAQIDLAVELAAGDERAHTLRSVEALLAGAIGSGGRIWIEPFVDVDRGMDLHDGLLDRLANPRPALTALRCLNSILFSQSGRWSPLAAPKPAGAQGIALRSERSDAWLVVPDHRQSAVIVPMDRRASDGAPPRTGCLYHLVEGTSQELTIPAGVSSIRLAPRDGPSLLSVPGISHSSATKGD